ncbi:tail fiber protein [Anabaena sp. CCY 9402-a]|uniref:tail fiber protein n=1 Tax=Anabaena sp. CCY 9402-a TaxID=3103867 RepID=UPI0039C72217
MRKIFQNGDLLTAEDVNAIAYPALDGTDFIGKGDKLPDTDLDDGADQIKSRFYNFYDRLKVSHSTGLTFSYLGGSVLLSSGVTVAISAATIAVVDNATSYIYVSNVGVVATASTLPNECYPLAKVTTLSGTISGSVVDLRDKLIDRVTPASIPATSSFLPGMSIDFWGATLPAGWLWCDGATYAISTYPALAAALGATFEVGGGNFRVPDKRGRTSVGAGAGTGLTARTVGQTFGNESHTLTVSEMPSHNHGVSDSGHNHGVTENPHTHGLSDPGHLHSFYANTTDGNSADRDRTDGFMSKGGVAITGEDTGGKGMITTNASGNQMVGTSATGIAVQGAKSGLSVNASSTGITINSQGGGGAHNNIQPSIACNHIIKI